MVYEFDDIRVDLARLVVTRAGRPLTLEPKAFDVLRTLIEGRDRLLTKDELLAAVWPGTFVTPNVLTRAVAQLRKALGDDAKDAKYVQTVATRGYRFIAPVRVSPSSGGVIESATAAVARPGPGTTRSRRVALAISVGVVLTAAVVLGWLALRADPDDRPGLLTTRRITTRNGYHGMAAVSPDSKLVAFSSERETGLEIVVSGLDAGSREQVITTDGGQNMQPSWSPDGRWLAFHSRSRGGIWIVSATGGPARQIVDFGSDPIWAPDGSRLAFTSDAGGMAAQSVLWTVGREGQDRRPLTVVGKPAGGHHEPAFSPDGRSVAFVVRRGGWTDELWLVPVEGGDPRRVAAGYGIKHPQFGPEGADLYWGGGVDTGQGRLWHTRLDHPGAEPASILNLDSGRLDGLSIGRDGTVVYSVATTDSNIWSIPAGSGDSRPAQAVQLTDDVGRSTYPDYSGDGRVTYVQFVAGNPAATWLISEDGRSRERLVPDLPIGRPQWIRDGTRLLAFRPIGERHEFAWVDAATRRVTPVPVDAPEIESARVSPDGNAIAYHVIQPDGVMNVFTRPLDGGPPVQVTHDREAASYPAWSPDGQRLVVELKRGDSTHLAVVSARGGPIEQITFERGQAWPHSWSPDNDHVVFAGQRGGVWNVWIVSRTTRRMRQLTDFTSAAGYVRYPSWSMRGDRIAFERARQAGSVWVGTGARAR